MVGQSIFKDKRYSNNEFLEYEEVYENRFYGTLKAQVESLEAKDIQVSMERIMNIRIKIQIRKLRKKVTIIL